MVVNQVRIKSLMLIKSIVDQDNNGDKFVLVRTKKNKEFLRENYLSLEDVKNIVKNLSIKDCFSGPEADRDDNYKGWIFKFSPIYNDIKLYIKIRIESRNKSICLSIHEFGKYD